MYQDENSMIERQHETINNQPSSGEDISFNIDCSQAFQLTNQTPDRPVTVGEINSIARHRAVNIENSEKRQRGQKEIRGAK